MNVINKRYDKSLSEIIKFLSFLNITSWTFPTLYTEKYFDWKIKDNPFRKSFCYLRFVGNNPVAHLSITAKPLNENLDIGSGLGELGDSHTHPDFQKQGHFGELGNQVIKEFSAIYNEDAFIYGIPNENSVHGYLSRCNCELLEYLNIGEYILDKKFKYQLDFPTNLSELKSDSEIDMIFNSVWNISYKRKLTLIKKDSNWWNWRYKLSSEQYKIFSIKLNDDYKKVYLIAKIRTKYFFSNIDICDIFGETEELELEMLNLFLIKFNSPLNRIRIWSKKNTKITELLIKKGFRFIRKINFILYRNLAYQVVRNKNFDFAIDLGDTDNV